MLMDEAAEFLGCSVRTIQRYMKNGKLPYTTKGKNKNFKKKDLFKIAGILHNNTAKHRPDAGEPKEKPLTKVQEMRKAIKAPTEALLNHVGKEILISTTKLVQENKLLDGIDKSTILRYAIAVQMKEHYLGLAHVSMEKYFFDIAKQFQTEIQHYEKELILTPAALQKLKPAEEKKEEVIDPMEALLSGK